MRRGPGKAGTKAAASPKAASPVSSPSPRAAQRGSPAGFGIAETRRAENAGTAAERRQREEEEAARAAEEARIAEEAAAEQARLEEEERLRNKTPSRPSTPAAQPLQLSVQVFMWLRDRAPAAARNVLPSTDRHHVVLPAETVAALFEGAMISGIVRGYMPRTDEQRTLKGAASLATPSPATLAGQTTGPSVTTAPRRGPKAHSVLQSLASPAKTRGRTGSSGSSPSPEPSTALGLDTTAASLQASGNTGASFGTMGSVGTMQPEDAVPRWKAGRFPAMEARYGHWNGIRRMCRRLGLEMSDGLIAEIADECDVDSLHSFLEGLFQCVRKADAMRREYSKSLVAEAAAPTPTHKAELHKQPPPSHVELVDRKLMKPVRLDGRRLHEPPAVPNAGGGSGDAGLPGQIEQGAVPRSASDSSLPSPSQSRRKTQAQSADAVPGATSTASAGESPKHPVGLVVGPGSELTDAPPRSDASTQTPGRVTIVYDDPADDPATWVAAQPQEPTPGSSTTGGAPAAEQEAPQAAEERQVPAEAPAEAADQPPTAAQDAAPAENAGVEGSAKDANGDESASPEAKSSGEGAAVAAPAPDPAPTVAPAADPAAQSTEPTEAKTAENEAPGDGAADNAAASTEPE